MRRKGAFKFPAKAKTPLVLLTVTAVAAFSVHRHRTDPSSLPVHKIRTGIQGLVRSSRALYTITYNIVDYKSSLAGIPSDSDEYRHTLSEVHLRSANRILKLCEKNKGFYVKAGQFVASLRQVPKEYSSTLSSLQDQAVPVDFKAIKKVLLDNFGKVVSEIFLSFDEQPIAAASIAQVHHAVLKDHQQVAVKVQYPGLEDQMKIDIATMALLSRLGSQVFPEYRFEWIVSEFRRTISLELDFVQEARNSERTSRNFKKNDVVRIPCVFWDLTRSQVLTMQFFTGRKVDDVEYIKAMGINPTKVAKALVDVFAEMIFVHGFLHGDPHPGNILVSPGGRRGFSLVILDHGVYKELDENFRLDYCMLWKALVFLDQKKIQYFGEKFGVRKYSRYFPVIFTGRTIDSKSALGEGMSLEEKRNLKQELNSLTMEDISLFMESLPPDFLAILRTDGLLKSIVSKLGASQRIRMLSYAKYAAYGLSIKSTAESGDGSILKYTVSRILAGISYIEMRVLLEIFELLSWVKALRDSLPDKFFTYLKK